MINLAREAGVVEVRSTAGEGDRVATLCEGAVCRPDHAHPAHRAASIRFAALVRLAAQAHAQRGRGGP